MSVQTHDLTIIISKLNRLGNIHGDLAVQSQRLQLLTENSLLTKDGEEDVHAEMQILQNQLPTESQLTDLENQLITLKGMW